MRRWVATAGFLLGCVACGGMFEEQEHALDPADHAVLIEARDLAPDFAGFTVDPSKETWSKVKSFGDWELEYTYEAEGFFVETTVFFNDSVTTAEGVMWTSGLMVSAVESGGVEYVETPGLLTLGDEQECGMLNRDGEPIGNFCIVRDGTIVYLLGIGGMAYEGPGGLDGLLGPALTAAKSHTPAEAPIQKEEP